MLWGGSGDAGYECVENKVVAYEGNIITQPYSVDGIWYFSASLPTGTSIQGDSLVITVSGTEYLPTAEYALPKATEGYGEFVDGNPVFTTYPCAVKFFTNYTAFYMDRAGDFRVKIEDVTSNITSVTPCFEKAVKQVTESDDAKPFVVTFSGPPGGNVSADKTYAEVNEAFNQGKAVQGILNIGDIENRMLQMGVVTGRIEGYHLQVALDNGVPRLRETTVTMISNDTVTVTYQSFKVDEWA